MRVLQSCNGARFTQLRGAVRSIPHCTTTHVDREQQRLPRGVGDSIGQLDVPPVLAVTLFGAFFIVLINTIVDIVYAALDPRIRLY